MFAPVVRIGKYVLGRLNIDYKVPCSSTRREKVSDTHGASVAPLQREQKYPWKLNVLRVYLSLALVFCTSLSLSCTTVVAKLAL